jgi:hypothetical protein|tara:strand:+ start:89 stop:310 length:222 start_codon:yes stop_codon:yes gene_type:complete
MIYVYIVVLSIMKDGEPHFSVRAPNATYKTEERCQAVRELNMLYLLETKPDPDAKFVSQCVGFPSPLSKKGDL